VADQSFDKPAMIAGVLALIGSGLFFLDRAGAVEVDEVVAVVSLWVGLALVGLVRSGLKLRERLSARG
jgi:hypothetical protein